MKIDGSGQRKTQRGVCSRAHGKREAHIGYKLSRGEGGFWTVFGTATLPTGTSRASMRGETVWSRCQTGLWPMPRPVFGTATLPTSTSVPTPRGKTVWNRCKTGLLPIAGRSLARHPRPQVLQSHLPVAKQSSDRSLTRRPCPQVTQCHPRVARLSGTGVKPVSCRCSGRYSARPPRPQVPL